MDIPPTLAQQLILTQQNIAIAVIRSNAQAAQAIATILDQAIGPSPRGGAVNFSA